MSQATTDRPSQPNLIPGPSPPQGSSEHGVGTASKGRWKRRLRNFTLVLALLLVVGGWLISDHVRTLWSLRRVDGTNVYVMDYYADYDMDEIRRNGMNLDDIEGSYIDAIFPQLIGSIARSLKSAFVPNDVNVVESSGGHHCSSVARYTEDGRMLFGRNFDGPNDAILVLRIHGENGVDSISVIDLKYLNLNRNDLIETNPISRIPLLFAPYYVMDGMNKHGLAVSAMSVDEARAPTFAGAPNVTQATAMRLILDYCASVDQAIKLLKEYNISFVGNAEHLMIVDSSGEMVVVEFMDGNTHLIQPTTNWLASTNHTLWSKSEQDNDNRCERYRAGSDAIAAASHAGDDESFAGAVRAMSVENWTMWTSIYDLNRLSANIMYKSNPELCFLDESMSQTKSAVGQ